MRGRVNRARRDAILIGIASLRHKLKRNPSYRELVAEIGGGKSNTHRLVRRMIVEGELPSAVMLDRG